MLHFTSNEHIQQKLVIFAPSIVKIMRFFRQTLLSVCLILPWGAFAQPIANDDAAATVEDMYRPERHARTAAGRLTVAAR